MSPFARLLHVLVFALAVAAGCGADGEDPSDAGSDGGSDAANAALVIGTGFPDFEALELGQEVPIIEGIQGGFHIWGGFLIRGVDPDDLSIDFTAELDGEVVASARYQDDLYLAFDPEAWPAFADGAWDYAYAAVAVIFDDAIDPDAISGSRLSFDVTVTDRNGVTVADSTEVVAICCSL